VTFTADVIIYKSST